MLKIGLTGGIGSGKSAVSRLFRQYAIPVIDSDEIAYQLTAAGQPALRQIAGCFGDTVLAANGTLDRRALASLVFADKRQRQRLEAILHPLIIGEMQQRLKCLTDPYVILAIPLLVESGLAGICDRILVVKAEIAIRYQRIRQRDGIDDAAIDRIVGSQASDAERLVVADDVIDNSGDEEDLQRQVAALHRQYLALQALSADVR